MRKNGPKLASKDDEKKKGGCNDFDTDDVYPFWETIFQTNVNDYFQRTRIARKVGFNIRQIVLKSIIYL